MNRDVIWCVLILISLCLIGAVGNTTWLASYSEYIPFLNTKTFEETKPFYDGFLVFWTFVITLQVIIPMSLYVTLEMTKLLQIYLIQQGKFRLFLNFLQFFIMLCSQIFMKQNSAETIFIFLFIFWKKNHNYYIALIHWITEELCLW